MYVYMHTIFYRKTIPSHGCAKVARQIVQEAGEVAQDQLQSFSGFLTRSPSPQPDLLYWSCGPCPSWPGPMCLLLTLSNY